MYLFPHIACSTNILDGNFAGRQGSGSNSQPNDVPCGPAVAEGVTDDFSQILLPLHHLREPRVRLHAFTIPHFICSSRGRNQVTITHVAIVIIVIDMGLICCCMNRFMHALEVLPRITPLGAADVGHAGAPIRPAFPRPLAARFAAKRGGATVSPTAVKVINT